MALDLVARLSLQDNLTAPMRRATRGMRQMSGAINSQVSSMGGLKSGLLGVAAGFATAAGAVKAFNATIGEAARFEASEVAIKAIFNDEGLSDSYLKMVDKMAIDSPLLNSTEMLASSKGLIAMTKDIEDLGKSWSIVEKLQVLDPTQGTDGATFALKEMFQGDSLSMVERFGLNKKELNRIKKLSIPEQIAEINSMLDGMGVTEAAINKMGSTTLGYWAQIGERADKFKRTIGGMGNSKIGEVLGGIVDKLDSIDLDAIAAKVDAVIGGAVQKIIDFGKKIWELRTPILAVGKAVGTFVGVVAGIIVAVKTVGLIGAAFGFLLSPIGLAALAIIGIGTAFKTVYKHSEKFRNALSGIGNAFKTVTAVLKGDSKGEMLGITRMLKNGMSTDQVNEVIAFANKLKKGFELVKNAVSGVSNLVSGNEMVGITKLLKAGLSTDQVNEVIAFVDRIKGAFSRLGDIFVEIGTALGTGDATGLLSALGFSPETISSILGFVETIKTTVTEFVAYLGEKWAELQPSIKMLIERFVSLKDTAIEIFTNLLNFLRPIFSAIGTAFQIIGDIAVMIWNNIIAPAIDFTISLFQALWNVAGPILELLGAAIGVAFELLKVAWDTILKPFAEWLLGAFTVAFETAKLHVDNIAGAFSFLGDMISGAVDWFNTIKDAIKNFKVPDWLSKLGGGGTVRFEESGGGGGKKGKSNYHGIDYVPYNGYQASLHKGERVQTAQEVREQERGGGGGPVSITGNTFNVRQESDIEAIAYELAKLIERERGQMA